MLGRALELRDVALRDAELSGEAVCILGPHRLSAIVAARALRLHLALSGLRELRQGSHLQSRLRSKRMCSDPTDGPWAGGKARTRPRDDRASSSYTAAVPRLKGPARVEDSYSRNPGQDATRSNQLLCGAHLGAGIRCLSLSMCSVPCLYPMPHNEPRQGILRPHRIPFQIESLGELERWHSQEDRHGGGTSSGPRARADRTTLRVQPRLGDEQAGDRRSAGRGLCSAPSGRADSAAVQLFDWLRRSAGLRENGGEKVGHGSGGMSPLRAA
jgi:hypothetical protein